MLTRPNLIRVAFALVLMAAFMVLADGMAQRQVWLAAGDAIATTGATHPAGAQVDE